MEWSPPKRHQSAKVANSNSHLIERSDRHEDYDNRTRLDLAKNVFQLNGVDTHEISKRGDTYLRTLLIHGARSVIRVAEAKANHAGSWLAGVMARRNKSVAAVALANKNARIVWALLAQELDYDADYRASA